jgi:hypothetical protein
MYIDNRSLEECNKYVDKYKGSVEPLEMVQMKVGSD